MVEEGGEMVEVEGGYERVGHDVEYEVEERQYVVGKDGQYHEVAGGAGGSSGSNAAGGGASGSSK